MSLTRTQKKAGLYLSVALGSIDAIMQEEKNGTARWNRLNGAIGQINRAIDLYVLEAFSVEDMDNAGALIDLVNDEIVKRYPPVSQTND